MLRLHFLNVGHGDCTIIEHPSGRLTMVDINNSQKFDAETFAEELAEERRKGMNLGMLAGLFASGQNTLLGQGMATPPPGNALALGMLSPTLQPSPFGAIDTASAKVEARAKTELTDPVAYMKRRFPNRRLWRLVLTHPDLDHMRGLKALYEHVGFDNFWDTAHTKDTPNFRSDGDRDDWNFYQSLRNGGNQMNVHRFTRGSMAYAFAKDQDGQTGGDNIEILSPTLDLVNSCNSSKKSNDISLVLRIHHAGKSVLLPGDAEQSAWDDMCRTYGARLKSDFLKASHHGRDTGFHSAALTHIAPTMVIVSVGKKPDTDASNRYRRHTQKQVASTRYYGNIQLDLNDDGSWGWCVERNYKDS